ncbi:MAG: tetratricopeptide repeat protein [Alicyclobacillus sp.]|nr:tetratricopeptide repeat protein [Alicyclobacillus sp.]
MSENWQERLQSGLALAAKGLYHAALEAWGAPRVWSCPDPVLRAQVCHATAKVYTFLGRYEQAAMTLLAALADPLPPDLEAKCLVALAVAYRYTDPDKAHRLLTTVLDRFRGQLSPSLRGVLYNNLGDVQWLSGFYQEGYRSIQRSLHAFRQAELHHLLPEVFNNLGVFALELGRYTEAQRYFMQAMRSGGRRSLYTLVELSRLFLLTDRPVRSAACARRALAMIWSAGLHSVQFEISRLCRLLALLCRLGGDPVTGLHLLEKAHLMFGQLGAWREWRLTQTELDQWPHAPGVHGTGFVQPWLPHTDIHQFLRLLDALQAQQTLCPQFTVWLDTRVWYARLLAEKLGYSGESLDTMVLAARFADYGLTALEAGIVENPVRSAAAWQQYRQHPSLSAELLTALHVSPEVVAIVADHHEHWDGSGFPAGKRGLDIHPLAAVLAVTDYYTQQVVTAERPHSAVLADLQAHAGEAFSPTVVNHFTRLFAEAAK